MLTFLLAFVVITLAMLGLAIGVVYGRPPIKGRCGSSCVCTRPRCANYQRRCQHAADH